MRRYSDRGVLNSVPLRVIVAVVATVLLVPFAFGWIGGSSDSEDTLDSEQSSGPDSLPDVEPELSVTDASVLSNSGGNASAAVVLDPSWYPKGISRYDAEGVIFGSTTETTEAPQTTSVGADPRTQPTSELEDEDSTDDVSGSATIPNTTQPSGGGTAAPSPTTTRQVTTTTKAPPKTTTTKATTTTALATTTTAAAAIQSPTDP